MRPKLTVRDVFPGPGGLYLTADGHAAAPHWLHHGWRIWGLIGAYDDPAGPRLLYLAIDPRCG